MAMSKEAVLISPVPGHGEVNEYRLQLDHDIGFPLRQYRPRYRVMHFGIYWIVRLKIV